MIFPGILHTSLGNVTVIRGVAPLGDLALCSEFNPEYQRNLIKTHKDEIERFLDDREYLFFPEVILSASLKFNSDAYEGKSVSDILYETRSISDANGFQVKTFSRKLPKTLESESGANALRLAYLELPDNQLDNGLKLFRIDGNHRLSAADNARPGESNYVLPTPFCIVLHEDTFQARRFDKVVFHNINAKQIPLTSEENLRLILKTGNDSLFNDKDLLESVNFGPTYYLARKLLHVIDDAYLSALKGPLENRRSLALSLTQFLIGKDVINETKDIADLDDQVQRLLKAFQTVNAIYQERPKLAENACHGILVAFLYFALHNEGKQLHAFDRWVTSNHIDHLTPPDTTTKGLGYHNHLGRIQAVDASSLVSVFKSVLTARKREIFISMDFRDDTLETYKTIQKTVRQINDIHKLDIRLREIRIDQFNKGHSYTITDEILELIEGSGLLIADLTFGNRNVYHEIGYLMGLNRGSGQEQNNFIFIADKKTRGEELESDIGFNLKDWQQLRFESMRQLEVNLTESLEIYYELRDNKQ